MLGDVLPAVVALAVSAVSAVPALADCRPVRDGSSYALGSGVVVACAGGRCVASVDDVPLASVAVAGDARVCDATAKQVERDLPKSCGAVRHYFAAVAQRMPAPGTTDEVVVDAWPAARPAACVPRYAEKRGDVWQRTTAVVGTGLAVQAFEEVDAEPGHGNTGKGPPPQFLGTVLLPRVAVAAAARVPRTIRAAAPVQAAPPSAAPKPVADVPQGATVHRF